MAPRRAAAAAASSYGGDHSNSESDTRTSDYPQNHAGSSNTTTTTTSRAAAKARNQALQNSQKEFLAKHINSNGPQDRKIGDPLDFEALSDKELRNYAKFYLQDSNNNNDQGVKSCLSLNGYLLESKIGEKTYSYQNKNRITKKELAAVAKKHFNGLNVKETEVLTNFLYKVNNQDKSFKLKFTNNGVNTNSTAAQPKE